MKQYSLKTQLRPEWHSVAKDLLGNLWILVLTAAMILMGSYLYRSKVYSPTYTSSATLVVHTKSTGSGNAANLSQASELASVFSNVFTTSTMKRYAAESLNMETFEGSIKASVLPNTNLLYVSVTASSPQLAYRLLTAVLQVYPQISDRIFENAVIDELIYPTVPAYPAASQLTKKAAFSAAAFGMALMTLLIIVLSILRDSVKDEESFDEKIGVRLLESIPHEQKHLSVRERLQRKKKSLLITDSLCSFRFSRNYQALATKIDYLHRHENLRSLLITSVTENEGKSTVVSNLAIALVSRGYRVLLLDMDFKKPSLQKIFSVTAEEDGDLGMLLSGKSHSASFRFTRFRRTRLYLGINNKAYPNYSEWINTPRVSKTIDLFAKSFDFVLIDSAPYTVSAEVGSIMRMTDKTVLVVRTDVAYTGDINDTIYAAKRSGKGFIGCVLNDVYPKFDMLGQTGVDESGYYTGKYYSSRYHSEPYASGYSSGNELMQFDASQIMEEEDGNVNN